jgi:hypothetical protein
MHPRSLRMRHLGRRRGVNEAVDGRRSAGTVEGRRDGRGGGCLRRRLEQAAADGVIALSRARRPGIWRSSGDMGKIWVAMHGI